MEKAEQKAESRTAETERHAVSQLALRLVEASGTEDIAEALAAVTATLVPWDAFLFSERVPDTELFRRILAIDTFDGEKSILRRDHNAYPYRSMPELHEGRAVIIHRPQAAESVALDRFGDKSHPSACLLFAPITIGGRLYGIVSVQSYTPYRFNEEDLELLKAIGGLVAPAMRRIQAEEALRVNQERYRRAIAQANAVPYEVDFTTYRMIYAGDGIRELTGYSDEELTREVWAGMIQERIPRGENEGYSWDRAVNRTHTGVVRSWRADYRIITRDGRSRWISDSAITLFDEQNVAYGSLGILQDITEQRQAEILREALIELGGRLSSVMTAREAGLAVADTASRLLGWDVCIVSFYSDQDRLARLHLMIDTVDGEKREFTEHYNAPSTPGPIYLRTLREGALLLTREQASRLHTEHVGNRERQAECMIYAPIRDKDRSIGLLSLQSYTPGAYSEDALRMLQVLADYCAATLQRTEALAALRTNEERYRRAIAQADAIPYEADIRNHRYIHMGDGLEKLVGCTTREDVQALWRSALRQVVMRGEAESMSFEEARDAILDGRLKSWRADYRLELRDGSEKWVADSAISLFDSEGRFFGTLGILQDITERMRAVSLNKALSELGRDLSGAKTAREVAMVVSKVAETLIGWDSFFLDLFIASENDIRGVLNIDTDEDGVKLPYGSIYTDRRRPSEAFLRTLREGPWMLLRDEDDSGPTLIVTGNVARRSASLLFVPVGEKEKEKFGVLSVQSYTPRAYDQADLELLETLADHCSSALGRAFAEENLRLSEERTTAFAALAHRLSVVTTAREAGLVIAETADKFLGWDACYIDLYSPEEDITYDVLNIDCVDGKKREYPSMTTGKKPTALGRRILRDGAFLELRDPSDTAPSSLGIPFGAGDRRSASLMYVPARTGDRIVALISIQSYRQNAYNADDLQLLQALADHCAGALERIRIEQSLVEERHRIVVFAELARHLSATTTPQDAARKLVEAARGLIGLDSAFVSLYSAEENISTPVLHFDTDDAGELHEVPNWQFAGTPLGYTRQTILRGKQIILRSPDETSPVGVPSFGNSRRRSASLLFVPLQKGDKIIGVMSVQSYSYNAYNTEDLDLLESMAQHGSGTFDRIQAQMAVRVSEERYALAAKGSNDGLWDWNLHTGEVYYSPRLKEMLGYREQEFGVEPSQWFSRVHPTDLPLLKEDLRIHLEGLNDHFQNEHRIERQGGQWLWVLCRGVAVRDESGKAVRIAGSMTDITVRRAAEDKLVQAAFYDALTGLPNRALFVDRLGRCFARFKRHVDLQFAVLFLDLDRFKLVNDSLGHLVGDQLLQQISARLLECVRENDTVARLGGDEFTILLDDIRDTNQAIRVAERILESFSPPFQIEGNEIFTGASIGIALSAPGYEAVDDLLRDADTALYRAKELGRGRFTLFDQKMHETVLSFLGIEMGLRNALRGTDEMKVHYQPVVSLEDNRIHGFEALARWKHPHRGLLMPDVFLPVAEDTGLILQLGECVLREACQQMAAWQARYPGARDLYVSVNISARQFASPKLAPLVECVLRETGLSASSLCLEITEAAILTEPESVRPLIDRWRSMGIRILLDDFGTGYSPFGHLLRVSVDFLKIHRSFVGTLENVPESEYIVKAIVSMAEHLRMAVVAEGAESARQIEILRRSGCQFAQGYEIRPPMDPAEAEKMLANPEEAVWKV